MLTNGPIGREALVKANETLKEYCDGKQQLEKRIRESEKWWKMRHWETQEGEQAGNPYDRKPKSAWLFNVIAGKHADAIEAYPEPMILPREHYLKGDFKRSDIYFVADMYIDYLFSRDRILSGQSYVGGDENVIEN